MKGAIFDLDNTLVDRGAAFVRWADPRVPPDQLARLVELDAAGHGDKQALFEALAPLVGASQAAVRRAFFDQIGGCCAPSVGAVALLQRLRGRVAVGVVTNGTGDVQRRKVEAAGLADLVDVVIVSGDVGAHKPSAAPFLAALEALRLRPEDSWMVGDHPINDVWGAQRLGMRTVWVRTPWFSPPAGADLVVDHLGELPWP